MVLNSYWELLQKGMGCKLPLRMPKFIHKNSSFMRQIIAGPTMRRRTCFCKCRKMTE